MPDYTYDETKPAALDLMSDGDDQLRADKAVIKSVLQDFTNFPTNPTFPNEGTGRAFRGNDADKGSPSYEGQIYIAPDTGKWYYADAVPAWVFGGYLGNATGGRKLTIPCGAGLRWCNVDAYETATGQTGGFDRALPDAGYYQFTFDPRIYGLAPTVLFVTVLAMHSSYTGFTLYTRLYNVTDAEAVTGSEATHTGATPGRYNKTLTVGDAAGNIKKASKTYRVELKMSTAAKWGALLGTWLEVTEG